MRVMNGARYLPGDGVPSLVQTALLTQKNAAFVGMESPGTEGNLADYKIQDFKVTCNTIVG